MLHWCERGSNLAYAPKGFINKSARLREFCRMTASRVIHVSSCLSLVDFLKIISGQSLS